MQQQLNLWPNSTEQTPCEQRQWENLNLEEQAERILLLAQLIVKAIRERTDRTASGGRS